jgi:ABC-type polysaccharide/polyol phosphate export permease
MTGALLKYRGFIWRRAMLDLRLKYAAADLGVLWNVLHPILLVLIYTFVFTYVLQRGTARDGVPYWLFLCSGLLPWVAFSECVTQGANGFQRAAPYLRRLAVPEEVFIAERALSATIGLSISFVILMVVAFAYGLTPSWHWALLPLALVLLQGLGFGIGLTLGTLCVFFRDIPPALPLLLRVAMWTAPVLYPATFIPERVRPYTLAHPVTPYMDAIRNLFLEQTVPAWWVWALCVGWVVVSVVIGSLVLRALRSEIRDVL